MSDGTFHAIDRGREQTFGPRAILICGYDAGAAPALSDLLQRIGADGCALRFACVSVLTMPLEKALSAQSEEPPIEADKLPRVMVLSGMTGGEIHDFLDGFSDTILPRPIFASATHNNLAFETRGLLAELLREHRAMMQSRQK